MPELWTLGIMPTLCMKKIFGIAVKIIYLVFKIGGAVTGFITHDSFGMGFATCGIIGGVLGLILATELILVTAVVVSFICSFKPFDPKKSHN